jgi:SAM-dependent methyltransferase
MSTLRDQDTKALADKYAVLNLEFQKKSGLTLLDNIGIDEGQTGLDYGSGTGDLALEAAKRVGKTGWVIGTDIREAGVKESNVRALNSPGLNVSFHVADETNVKEVVGKFVKEPLDFCFSNSVWHWIAVERRTQLAKDLFSLLRPGGKLAISGGCGSFPHPHDGKMRVLGQPKYAQYKAKGIPVLPTVDELKLLMTDLGLTEYDYSLDLIPKTQVHEGWKQLVDWLDSSTSGNFGYVGFLPANLQEEARREIMAEYEKLGDGKVEMELTLIRVIATKPTPKH